MIFINSLIIESLDEIYLELAIDINTKLYTTNALPYHTFKKTQDSLLKLLKKV